MPLKLSSAALSQGAAIPRRHTGDGEDLSPPLTWSGVPPEAVEFVLIVDDPDAPSREPWVHWVIYRINPNEHGLAEAIHPKASPPFPAGSLQGKNSWGSVGYRGPAPPSGHGIHRYFFRLYALDASLPLAAGLDKAGVFRAMQGHILAEAELMGTYERS